MLEKLTTITLSGANFAQPTSLEFFNPIVINNNQPQERIPKGSLLYGRNGSGKSTIARAFKKIAGEDNPAITADISDKDGLPVELSEEEKRHIFVFDEEFVDKNVKLKEDSLETIVMLGEEVDLAEQIQKVEKEIETARKDCEDTKKEYDEYLDPTNPKSPLCYHSKMLRTLRGNESWSERDKLIRERSINSPVRDDTYQQFVNIIPSKSKTELIIDFRDRLKEFEDAKSGLTEIRDIVPGIPASYATYNDQAVVDILAEKIEKPELSERERKLLTIKTDELNNRLDVFKKDETVECPYCFQALSPDYKSALIAGIEKVLSKAVEEHQKKLYDLIRDEVPFNLERFKDLSGVQQCIDLIEKINNAIVDNNEKLNRKRTNPFEPVNTESNIGALVSLLETALKELEKERLAYNEAAGKTEPIKAELNRINNEITHYDIIEDAKKYEEQNIKKEKTEKLYKDFEGILNQKIAVLEDLNAKRHDIKLAVDHINACMDYIFFAKDRLKIECENGVYKLRSRGRRVNPKEVSVGERNIIGLSYFFTSILRGKEEKDAYGEEYLLVIDDPVSSYDTENRIGILSFLRYMLGMFLEGNRYTKALVMTHDIMTFYDFLHIFDEIEGECNTRTMTVNGTPRKVCDPPAKCSCFELSNNTTIKFDRKKRHEYTELLTGIFKYAVGQDQDEQHDLMIGNMMRQAMEAYATFVYKKGIAEVSIDQNILDQLPAPEYKTYYNNLMYRLVLHGGSHREEQVKAMRDFRFFELISREEKIRTAKEILCFLFLLNKIHVLEHLKKCKDVLSTLESWCNKIKNGIPL